MCFIALQVMEARRPPENEVKVVELSWPVTLDASFVYSRVLRLTSIQGE